MKKQMKISIYELNPRFFSDSSGNGIGDLNGLFKKLDYFKFLGVDAIVIQNALSINSEIGVNDFKTIDSEIGTIDDFKKIIVEAKKIGIKVLIDLKIGSIPMEHEWFKQSIQKASKDLESTFVELKQNKEDFFEDGIEDKNTIEFNEKANVYHKIDTRTREIPINWNSNKVSDEFVSVIKFWNNLGINGFVFKDFEFIAETNKDISMSEPTLKRLRKFYISIKEINDNLLIIGKSPIVEMDDADMFTEGTRKVFDYFQSSKISLLGSSEEFGIDRIGKFSIKKLISKLKVYSSNPKNIISFGSEYIGRIASRWADTGQYHNESVKSLAMISMLLPASNSIYMSDELGAKNIGLTHLDDFQDKDFEYRKKLAAENKINEREFMDAQVLQNPINARSLMMWNKNKNGGFSKADITVSPMSEDYREYNVEEQYSDKTSVLNFFKRLISFIQVDTHREIFEKGTLKISSIAALQSVVKAEITYGDKSIISVINFSESVRKVGGNNKEFNVVISSYGNKKYSEVPKKLEAYESIIITNFKNFGTTTSKNEVIEKPIEIKVEEPKVKIEEIKPQFEMPVKKVVTPPTPTPNKNVVDAADEALKIRKAEEKKAKIQEMILSDSDFKNSKEQFEELSKIDVKAEEHTKLTEDEIAPTTQIDIDDFDDIEDFLKKNH